MRGGGDVDGEYVTRGEKGEKVEPRMDADDNRDRRIKILSTDFADSTDF